MEQFTFVKRGYDPEEVDKYITTLEQVIKSYKDKDNAIKNSIITAQMTADNIMRTAQAQADTYKLQIGEQLTYMRDTLEQQRKHLQAFQEIYANMLRKYIQELEQSNMNELFTKIDEMDKAIDELQSMDIVESDVRNDYLGQDTASQYTRPSLPDHGLDSRQALRDFGDGPPTRETSRDYQRETQEPRDIMREPVRDMPRETARDIPRDMPRQEARDIPRDMPRQEARDMHRQTREIASEIPREAPRSREALYHQEPASHTSREAMHPVARESMPREIPRDTHDIPQAFQREREPAVPQMREMPRDNPRDMAPRQIQDAMHNEANQDMHQGTAWDTPQEQHMPGYNRETIRDPREAARDPRGEYLTPAPVDREIRDPRRDLRRDTSRDMRRDTGRDIRGDVRRDPSRDMMRDAGPIRHDSREPIRDMGRAYLPEQEDYGDDQSLLPPVASLM